MMNGLVRNDAGRPNNTWQNLAETVISFRSLPRLFITVLSVTVPMFGFITFIAVYATPLSPIPSGDGHKTQDTYATPLSPIPSGDGHKTY